MNTAKSLGRLGRPPKNEAPNTRERILDAALDLFASQGYAGTSMRQIAQAVGVRESALYAHFTGKQAIYDALMNIGGPGTVLGFLNDETLKHEEADPTTYIRRLGRLAMTAWDEPRARRLISVAIREGILSSSNEHLSLLAMIAAVQQRLAIIFQRWADAGLICRDMPAEHLVWELFAPLNAIRILYMHGQASEEEREAGKQRAEQHLDFFIRSLHRT